MILGTGIDVVHVSRLNRWLKNRKLMERFFHEEEIIASLSRGKSAALSLAARFAAKEAFGKALGTGLKGIALKDILVRNNNEGKPELLVVNSAFTAFVNSGAKRIHLSMTHESDNAIAIVILEA